MMFSITKKEQKNLDLKLQEALNGVHKAHKEFEKTTLVVQNFIEDFKKRHRSQ